MNLQSGMYLCGQGKWFKTKIKIELGLWYLTPLSKMSVRYWWSVLLLDETGVPGENHRPAASHLQT
jgi:hypothetical protein